MLQTLKRLYRETANPDILPGTSSRRIAGLVISADIIVSLGLFFSAYSIAISHSSGFVVGGFLLLLFRFTGIDKSSATITAVGTLQKTLTIIIYALLQVTLRAGSIVSVSYLHLPDGVALGLGILVAAFIGRYSSYLLLSRPLNWLGLGVALGACVFALRLVFLGSMDVMPQEAYYWNYAQHLSPGYLDHPPLVAATIYVSEIIFGHNAWGTRFGAFIYGLIFIFIFYRYARLQLEHNCAVFASVLALLLPYFFMGSGFLITPDASLSMAWVMALYFFYRALLKEEANAWYGVGFAMGLGMLSKYTIALLAPAALLFILLDPRARRQLLRKEPYLSVIIAAVVFSPVIYWNATHNWASFAFQAVGRFADVPDIYLGKMFKNILALVTPLPLLALPYLFITNPVREGEALQSPFNPRLRLFIGSFLLVPMSVFLWNALENEPRYNWTGPLWISLLPMLAWLIMNAGKLRWVVLGALLQRLTAPIFFLLIGAYAVFLQLLSVGLPAVDFPSGATRLLGWPEASRNLLTIQKQLSENNNPIVVVGMDKYFIASKLAYFGTQEFLGDGQTLRVTGSHLLGRNSLMFNYWNPAEEFRGANVIMLSRDKSILTDNKLKHYFETLSPAVMPFPIYKNDFSLPKKTIREYYYRIGFDYKPRINP